MWPLSLVCPTFDTRGIIRSSLKTITPLDNSCVECWICLVCLIAMCVVSHFWNPPPVFLPFVAKSGKHILFSCVMGKSGGKIEQDKNEYCKGFGTKADKNGGTARELNRGTIQEE